MERPSRSDEHLSREEETKMEGATREYFDGLAPKRHTKPQRSEYSAHYSDAIADNPDNGVIPECLQFQHLENNSQKLVYSGGKPPEEFVETEYYKDLNCIDKQHHTTGTGFIKVDNATEMNVELVTDSTFVCHPSCKGNPATNDWIPTPDDVVNYVSGKPKRSDS